jgi:hypothetical protein
LTDENDETTDVDAHTSKPEAPEHHPGEKTGVNTFDVDGWENKLEYLLSTSQKIMPSNLLAEGLLYSDRFCKGPHDIKHTDIHHHGTQHNDVQQRNTLTKTLSIVKKCYYTDCLVS